MIHPDRRRESKKTIPIKPEKQKAFFDIGAWWFICPVCKTDLDIGDNCRACEQVIDWKDVFEELKDGS